MVVDIIVIAVIALSAYMGYKKGFVKTVSKLCCLVVSFIVAKLLKPYVGDFVKKSFIGEYISKKITESSTEMIGENMPSFIEKAGEQTANGITDAVVGVVTVLLIILVTYVVANFVVGALNVVAKFPVISFANRTLGIAGGLFMGIFLVYLIFAIMVLADVTGVEKWFADSVVAYKMYNDNILMNIIF